MTTPLSSYEILIKPSICTGTVQIPSSKSLSHRALICAGLAQGTSIISRLSQSRDIQATQDCLKALGASISQIDETTVEVQGTAPQQLLAPVTLDAYESGSTLRFFIPIAASGCENVKFLGQPSLLSRPMGIYADLFESMTLPFDQSAKGISFHGPLQGGLYTIPGNISSQFVSGMLFSLPLTNGGAIAVLPPYESKSYVDLTVQMMKKFGVQVDQPSDHGYEIAFDQHYQPADVTVEGDDSQMAFFAVLAAIQSKITCANMNPDSIQGDRVILKLLQDAGAKITWNQDAVTIEKDQLKPLSIDLSNCPDLGPILCVLAAYTPGTTTIHHAARLRYKECDRISAMEEELKKWGVDISSDEDSITISGSQSYDTKNVIICSHNDHRIVMAMTVFALCAKTPSVIEAAQAVTKSYPAFFADLQALNALIVLKQETV